VEAREPDAVSLDQLLASDAGGAQEAFDRGLRRADAGALALLRPVGLGRGQALGAQRQPPRAGESLELLEPEVRRLQALDGHALEVARRAGLHPRGYLLGKELEQQLRHQASSAAASSLCEPSQSGGVEVRLQVQNSTRRVSGATHSRGSRLVTSWEPSQNGCVDERPHRHHQ
jgi:hypothetical protein